MRKCIYEIVCGKFAYVLKRSTLTENCKIKYPVSYYSTRKKAKQAGETWLFYAQLKG